MTDFFRFPHTPHLVWLGDGEPRDDKVLSPQEAATLLANEVVVEEKLDGANLGISLGADGMLRAQNRGQYLTEPLAGQFARFPSWLAEHANTLLASLTPDLMLFGEWCAARHSLDYIALPDWYLLFDVYDRAKGRFWSTSRRDSLAQVAGLSTVPEVLRGRVTVAALEKRLMTMQSQYRAGEPPEGVVVRRESTEWCDARAKIVRPDFTQTIDTHWRRRAIEWNRVNPVQRARA